MKVLSKDGKCLNHSTKAILTRSYSHQPFWRTRAICGPDWHHQINLDSKRSILFPQGLQWVCLKIPKPWGKSLIFLWYMYLILNFPQTSRSLSWFFFKTWQKAWRLRNPNLWNSVAFCSSRHQIEAGMPWCR